MEEKKPPTAAEMQHAGFEAVVAFNWGVTRFGDVLMLNLSHPRHGPLSFALPLPLAQALVAALQERLASTAPTPPPVPPTMTH